MNNLNEKIKRLIETAGVYQNDRNQLHTDIMKAIEDSYAGDIMFIRRKITEMERVEITGSMESMPIRIPDKISNDYEQEGRKGILEDII